MAERDWYHSKRLHALLIGMSLTGFLGGCDLINRLRGSGDDSPSESAGDTPTQAANVEQYQGDGGDWDPMAAAEPTKNAAEGPVGSAKASSAARTPREGTFESKRDRADLIQPGQIQYLGAFRLPDENNGSNWEWSGGALTYSPDGDPQGSGDGHPGSLFGIGHAWQTMVSEISIPTPVIPQGALDNLSRAKTLQPFTNIKRGRIPDAEIPVVALEYVTGPQGKRPGVLLYAFGQHMQEQSFAPTHGWVSLNLQDERIIGPFRMGDLQNYATNNYMFEIPTSWAAQHTKGKRVATGRFREGGQGSRGPTLVAFDPFNEAAGSLPAQGEKLPATPLLLYRTAYDDGNHGILEGYQHCDDWVGGAWLESGERSAVVFIGSKTVNECWYGFSDGTRHPNPEDRVGPGDRGWWATAYAGTLLFYDPNDLAAVASGSSNANRPQPYASLTIDQFLHNIQNPQQQYRIQSMAYDRERNIMYVLQFRADEDRSLIHAFRLQ